MVDIKDWVGRHYSQHRVCLMVGDRVARSVSKFIYIRVGGQIRWIYPPLNKPKTLAATIFKKVTP
jgi:hypothetical protein